jgi:hypothetical protein
MSAEFVEAGRNEYVMAEGAEQAIEKWGRVY